MKDVLTWDIWEVSCRDELLHGVMFRGRIRKFALQENMTCLTENASDKDNVVRFALIAGTSPDSIISFVQTLVAEVEVTKVNDSVQNPILSKLKVNDESRYTI